MDGTLPPDEDDARPRSMDGQAAVPKGLAAVPRGLVVPAKGLATLATPGDVLAMPEGLIAPVVEARTDAMSNALALVRTLLRTAPPPTIQYNLPVVDVQR
jgi:hypothetical protein